MVILKKQLIAYLLRRMNKEENKICKMSEKGAGADRNGDIKALCAEISQLRASLADKEQRLRDLEAETASTTSGLSNDDIARYSRQLILPRFGVSAQLKLKHSAFLIVGMGGLGCPAAQYLLAAGCGRLGLVDYDEVERSNFHRQTLHTEARVGLPKVESARHALAEINPGCQIATHRMLLTSENALELIADYDVVLDCTDNVATRYLLNDACVMLRKPLVSGSALQLDGQLTVYSYGETGPCFRCIFPVPPPPETVTNCSDAGVLGAVTGVIGSLQALEAIKVAVNVDCGGDGHNLGEVLAGRLLIFNGARCIFRNLKLRSRRDNCSVCSAQATITRLIDYEQFCGMRASDKDYVLTLLAPDDRLQVQEYARTLQLQPHLLIDVRAPAEFQICRLPGAINVPLKQVLDDTYAQRHASQLGDDDTLPIVVLCRRGNDSQLAVEHLRSKLPRRTIHDLIGGLHAWHYKIDGEFPIY